MATRPRTCSTRCAGSPKSTDERRHGADEQCSPGYSCPRRRRREPAQLALTVVAPRRRSPSPPWHNLIPLPAEPRCSAGRCWSLDLLDRSVKISRVPSRPR